MKQKFSRAAVLGISFFAMIFFISPVGQVSAANTGGCSSVGQACTGGVCAQNQETGDIYCKPSAQGSNTSTGSKCYDSFGTEVACTYDPATGASTASPVPSGNAAPAPATAASAPAAASKRDSVAPGAVQGLYIPRGSSIGLSDMPVTRLIENLMKWLLYIVGFVAIIAFVIAGLQYLLAGADSKMAEKAKESMTYAMIGVLVALSALIVIRAIQAVLSGSMIF